MAVACRRSGSRGCGWSLLIWTAPCSIRTGRSRNGRPARWRPRAPAASTSFPSRDARPKPRGRSPRLRVCGPLAVCANGAVVVDLERAEVLEISEIAGAIATGLVDLVRRATPDILLASDDLERFCYERGFFAGAVDWEEILEEVDDIRPVVATGCIKLIARTNETTAPQLIELLQREVGEVGHVTTSGLDWVDIGAPQVSKAYALERVCDRLGVGIEEVVAVGDNHNDLSVLGWASSAMAPANAIPDVLAVVERVLPANSDDGVACLLEELVAIRE